jgi:hypothetical protein
MATKAQVIKAKALVKRAGGAAQQLEADVRELVTMRAWDILGYENFSVMWEVENGFKCPRFVVVVAIDELTDGVDRGRGRPKAGTTHMTHLQAAELLGQRRSTVAGVSQQIREGVPLSAATLTSGPAAHRVISLHGRAKPQRRGKMPEEKVMVGFHIERFAADEIARIASAADVPNAEIYRQAVHEYLARHKESR